MDKIFTEENGYYSIDWSNAVWATDEINAKYHTAKCSLSDVDWIMETKDKLFLVEYKNAKVQGAKKPGAFKPKDEKVLNKVAKKFYDSLHYLYLTEKKKTPHSILGYEIQMKDSTN